MKFNRKEFLLTGSAAAAALLTQPLQGLTDEPSKKLRRFGLQLYSVRDVFEKDPAGTLQQLAGMGYKEIEGYERAPGIFWGMKPADFKKRMDDLDMTFISSHCEIEKDFERKAGEAAAVGMKYLIYNWPFSVQPMEAYRVKAEQFNRCGEICRKAGIRFAYHNYESSFRQVDGIFPHDFLMKETDPGLVDHQMDIYWVLMAGQDPSHWLKKYPNRFRLCHIKDRVKGSTKREDTCELGTGSIDFPSVLKAARKNGMKYYIAEQEHYPNRSPLEAARYNAQFLSKISI